MLPASRRNITKEQKRYLIGKRYTNEKKGMGEHVGNQHTKELEDGKSYHIPTASKIAEQTKVSEKTVRTAETFSKAVDEVSKNTGLKTQEILSRTIKASQKDIQTRRKRKGHLLEIDEKVNENIKRLYLRCYSENSIVDELARQGIDMNQSQVHKRIEVILNGQMSNLNTPPEDLQLYNVWNFAKNNNETKHFGNVPTEITENLHSNKAVCQISDKPIVLECWL